jgi:hypothetical protein
LVLHRRRNRRAYRDQQQQQSDTMDQLIIAGYLVKSLLKYRQLFLFLGPLNQLVSVSPRRQILAAARACSTNRFSRR